MFMINLLSIIIIYIITVFILSRLVIPHLGFKKDNLPINISDNINRKIQELKNKANSKNEFLKLAYDFLGSKYKTGRLLTFLKLHYLFKNVDEVWDMSGFMPCTQSGYLMRIFLIRSGFFKEEEICIKHTFVDFNIHQYLQVKINDVWLDVDVGEQQRGMLIGNHLKFFG